MHIKVIYNITTLFKSVFQYQMAILTMQNQLLHQPNIFSKLYF